MIFQAWTLASGLTLLTPPKYERDRKRSLPCRGPISDSWRYVADVEKSICHARRSGMSRTAGNARLVARYAVGWNSARCRFNRFRSRRSSFSRSSLNPRPKYDTRLPWGASGPPAFHSEFQSPHQRPRNEQGRTAIPSQTWRSILAPGLIRNSGVQQCRLHTRTNRAVSPASAAGRRTSEARTLIHSRVRSSSSGMKIESAQSSRQPTPSRTARLRRRSHP
jgi:hypothetical protein